MHKCGSRGKLRYYTISSAYASKLGCFAKPEVDFAQPCNLSFIDSFAIAGGEAKLYEVDFQINVIFGKPDRRANCGKNDCRFQPFKLALIFVKEH